MSTPITAEQFNQIFSSGHAPHDVVQEEGRLGVAFNVGGKGIVAAWQIGDESFLETPKSFDEARQILSL